MEDNEKCDTACAACCECCQFIRLNIKAALNDITFVSKRVDKAYVLMCVKKRLDILYNALAECREDEHRMGDMY